MLAQLGVLLLLPFMSCLFRMKIEILCWWIRSSSSLRELHCISLSLEGLQSSFHGALRLSDLLTTKLFLWSLILVVWNSVRFNFAVDLFHTRREDKRISSLWIPRSLNEKALTLIESLFNWLLCYLKNINTHKLAFERFLSIEFGTRNLLVGATCSVSFKNQYHQYQF